jgi:hypothetical protein
MAKWEYLTVKLEQVRGEGFLSIAVWNAESFTQQMNFYGEQGWELVSHFPISEGSGYTAAVFATFKRKIEE